MNNEDRLSKRGINLIFSKIKEGDNRCFLFGIGFGCIIIDMIGVQDNQDMEVLGMTPSNLLLCLLHM